MSMLLLGCGGGSFEGGEPTPNIIHSYSYIGIGLGLVQLYLSDNLDSTEEYLEGEGGIEVFHDGNWVAADMYIWYLETGNIIEFLFSLPEFAGGTQWRLSSPTTTWTVGGHPLNPTSGVLEEVQNLSMSTESKFDIKNMRE